MLSTLVSFLAVCALLVAIPGPATTLVMKNAATRGLRSAITTALGVLTADLVWMAASVVGLTAILVASESAFLALRLAGAAYLIWIGVRLLLSRHGLPATHTAAGSADTKVTAARAYREGVICDLSNPKTLLVFTSVIPQFLHGRTSPVALAALGTAFALTGFVSLGVYAVLFARARSLTTGTRIGARAINLSGAVLILFGIRIATEPT